MELRHKTIAGLPLRTSPQLEALGIPHGFTTRQGGVSGGYLSSLNLGTGRGDDPACVRENYRRVCAALGADMDKLVFAVQVHGSDVRPVTADDLGKGLDRSTDYRADGLCTDLPGAVLTVFAADCCPILLCDPVRRVVGAVHAGWRGTALGAAARTVETMERVYGCDPGNIRAAIGPCISLCCFETGPEVPRAMTDALGESALGFIREDGKGKYHVDLKGLNGLWLERAGVPRTRIDRSDECTMCLPEKYWSHRYTRGERGSQAALIALPTGGER